MTAGRPQERGRRPTARTGTTRKTEPKALLGLGEVAEHLGIHYMTAYRYVRTGVLEAHREAGQWRIREDALDAFRSMSEPAGGHRRNDPVTGGRTTERPTRLADRLVAGDEAGCWQVIQQALAAGSEPAEVYVELLGGALREVGDRWEAGTVSVADEHRASVVAMRLIGRLGAQRSRRGRTRGSVVLAAAPSDRHGLPTAIVADLLRAKGLRVADLGADTPGEELLAATAEEDHLVAIGICATNPLGRSGERELRRSIRLVREGMRRPVLLGGAAVRSAGEAQRLGADHWTGTASEVVERVEALLATRAASSQVRS